MIKYLVLFALLSCASKNKKEVEEVRTVSLLTRQKDSIKIDKDKDGPLLAEGDESSQDKQPNIALTVYSSLYHSLGIIELLKELERKKIPLHTVSSHGFAVITLALYARDRSVSRVEWSLFKLLKNLKGKTPYSKSWEATLADFIDKEFSNGKLEELNPRLVIPLLEQENKIVFQRRGPVKQALKKMINLEHKQNYLGKSQIYHYSIERKDVDLNFAVSFLPLSPTFNKLNGYPYGLITRHLGLILNSEEDVSLLRGDKISSIDKLSAMTDINQMYKAQISTFVQNLENKIKNWKEYGDSSFQY